MYRLLLTVRAAHIYHQTVITENKLKLSWAKLSLPLDQASVTSSIPVTENALIFNHLPWIPWIPLLSSNKTTRKTLIFQMEFIENRRIIVRTPTQVVINEVFYRAYQKKRKNSLISQELL